MNLSRLKPFIERSAKSSDPQIKKAADSLVDQMIAAQQAEEITQPTLHAQSQNKPLNQKPKDEVDQQIDGWMVDVAKPEPDASNFGKAASAYACDIEVSKLPKDTQSDIKRFAPTSNGKTRVVQYGMVESELVSKVDAHNFKKAEANIQQEINKKGKRALADKFQEKIPNKYILILNDSIIDGHHFLAMAKALGITCSLKVLDLTPIRFQKSAASSLFDYVVHNYSRKGAA